MGHTYKIDFHTHTQDHKRFDRFKHTRAFDEPLSDEDKTDIHACLIAARDRGLDAVVISDHNQFTSGFYAREYAERVGAPIKVIPGCECSVIYNHNEVHVLAIGCKTAFSYDKDLHISHVVRLIHDNGGIAVLSHPQNYLWVTGDLLQYVDGVEVFNGMVSTLQPGIGGYSPPESFKGLKTVGSDYHHENPVSINAYTNVVEGSDLHNAIKEWL